jgi:RimJ/RimL family protein N-acetyltransferase
MAAPHAFLTPRLRAERFTLEHVGELALLDTDPLVQATIFGKTYTLDQTRERVQRRVAMWDEHGFGDYVARLRDGTFVGAAGVFPMPSDAIAIGYALRPQYWGRGYATELAEQLTAIALGLDPAAVIATVLEHHFASRRILEKVGFVSQGINPDDPETVRYRYAGARSGSIGN